MAHDQYPLGESKLGSIADIKQRVLGSITYGILGSLVAMRVTNSAELIAGETSQVLKDIAEVLQPKANSEKIRWIGELKASEVKPEEEPIIFYLADEFGLRLPVDHELPAVKDPLLIVEGGANRTSVVRRKLAEEMLGGENGGVIYQLGSPNRLITPTRKDKDDNVVENAEYKVITASDICGDLDGKTISEFDVNVASAISNGYEFVDDSDNSCLVLRKGNITLIAIKALGLEDGVETLDRSGLIEGRNVVVCTNGQYRTKAIIQAEHTLNSLGVSTESITAIGDETGNRNAKIYSAELAVVLRELAKYPD